MAYTPRRSSPGVGDSVGGVTRAARRADPASPPFEGDSRQPPSPAVASPAMNSRRCMIGESNPPGVGDQCAVIGREMWRTWEQMLDLLSKGLDLQEIVSAEMSLDQFAQGVERFGKGLESKVVLYPRGKPR